MATIEARAEPGAGRWHRMYVRFRCWLADHSPFRWRRRKVARRRWADPQFRSWVIERITESDARRSSDSPPQPMTRAQLQADLAIDELRAQVAAANSAT